MREMSINNIKPSEFMKFNVWIGNIYLTKAGDKNIRKSQNFQRNIIITNNSSFLLLILHAVKQSLEKIFILTEFQNRLILMWFYSIIWKCKNLFLIKQSFLDTSFEKWSFLFWNILNFLVFILLRLNYSQWLN